MNNTRTLPSTTPLVSWVGREYPPGRCWNLVRDAFDEVGGVKLPDNYYAALRFFTQVHDASRWTFGDSFARKPVFGLIGEGRDSEAVIPLPSGGVQVSGSDSKPFIFTTPPPPFVPQPWDVPMLSTIGGIRILPIHPGLAIDSERFLMTWGDSGQAGIWRFDDARVSRYIAGFIRLIA
jgi:hypothetical protein